MHIHSLHVHTYHIHSLHVHITCIYMFCMYTHILYMYTHIVYMYNLYICTQTTSNIYILYIYTHIMYMYNLYMYTHTFCTCTQTTHNIYILTCTHMYIFFSCCTTLSCSLKIYWHILIWLLSILITSNHNISFYQELLRCYLILLISLYQRYTIDACTYMNIDKVEIIILIECLCLNLLWAVLYMKLMKFSI